MLSTYCVPGLVGIFKLSHQTNPGWQVRLCHLQMKSEAQGSRYPAQDTTL